MVVRHPSDIQGCRRDVTQLPVPVLASADQRHTWSIFTVSVIEVVSCSTSSKRVSPRRISQNTNRLQTYRDSHTRSNSLHKCGSYLYCMYILRTFTVQTKIPVCMSYYHNRYSEHQFVHHIPTHTSCVWHTDAVSRCTCGLNGKCMSASCVEGTGPGKVSFPQRAFWHYTVPVDCLF